MIADVIAIISCPVFSVT